MYLPGESSLPTGELPLLRDAVNYLHKENRTFEAAKMLARPWPLDGGWPMVKFHDFHDFHEFTRKSLMGKARHFDHFDHGHFL